MENNENKNINVLIIEDNPADARLVSIMLKEDPNQPFTIKSCGLLEEGLKLLKQEKFDVVLLGLNLPDCAGLGGLEQISAAHPGAPVILLTNLNDESLASDALQKNAADYLVKGQINTNLLVRSIRYSRERNKRENELRKLNRTLHALSKTSQAMELNSDEFKYLRQVCGIIVEDCGYSMVWVGYRQEDEAKTIRPVAYAGFEDGYLDTLNLTWADTERGRGPTGTAVRTGKVRVCRDMLVNPEFKPWREEALKRGYASSIAIPISIGGGVLGALTIYSKETDPFSKDEVRLLSELAGRLAYGIMAIRLRTTQLKAEEKLQTAMQRFYLILSNMQSGVLLVSDEGRIEFVNESFCGMYGLKESPDSLSGLSSDEMIGKIRNSFKDPASAEARIKEIIRLGQPVTGEEGDINGERTFLWNFIPIRINEKIYGRLWVQLDITARKKAENALRSNRERLDIALVSSRMATFDWDIVNDKRIWSAGVHSLLGTKPESFTGLAEDFFRVMPPEDRLAVQADLAKAIKTGIYETEYRAIWPDSSVHHIAARGKVHYDNTGRAVLLTGVCWDVTGRKQAEDALRESESRWQVHALRFSLLSEIAGRLLQSPEPQKLVEALCRKVLEHLDCQVFFNFLADEKKGRLHLNAYAGIPEEEAKRIEWLDYGAAVCGCAAKDGRPVVAEHIPSTPDARTELVKSYGVKAYACHPILADNGKVMGTLSFGTMTRETFSKSDLAFMKTVTDHVAVAMARLNYIRELDGLARYLRENPSPVLRVSSGGDLLYANESSALLLKAWNCRVNDKAPEQVRAMAAESLGSGRNKEHELTCGDIVYSLMFSPVAAEGFVNVYGRDITERKKAEEVLKRDKDTIEKLVVKRTEELLNARVELERSKRLSDIGTLAATVAHELRNPLGVIRTAAYNIKRKNKNDNLDSHLANIEKKISESNQIINNLLDYSRIKTPVFEKIKVYSILEECVNYEKERFEKKNINFNRDIEPVKNLYIEADPLQLREIFNNILDNACQAIDKSPGRIDVSAAPDGKKNVIIAIKDNGMGIEQEDIKRLFEPFFTRKSKGTGLGLTISNQLIGLHNGRIGVESSPGKGTKVTVALPVGVEAK